MLIDRKDLYLLDKIVLGRAIFNSPFKANSSLHDEARFVHIIKGNTRLHVPNESLNLETGDSILMKCDNFVNNWLKNEDGEPSEVMVLQLYPEVLQYVYSDQVPDLFTKKVDADPGPVEKIAWNPMFDHFIQGLRYYFDNPTLISDELIKIKIKELIHVLVTSDTTGRVRAILSNLFRSRSYDFKEIVQSHLFEDLNVEDLAFFAGMSLSSFKRKFKSVYGTSPAQYIKTKRLEKAESLLRSTDQRISDVAYSSGFNDTAYFSKAFSSAYQYSPSEYRKLHLS